VLKRRMRSWAMLVLPIWPTTLAYDERGRTAPIFARTSAGTA
jgi:hypothetical protein